MRKKVFRQLSLAALLLHGLIMAGLIFVAILLLDNLVYGMMLGAAVYLLWSQGTRRLALRHHRQGMRALRARRFDEAISHFSAQAETCEKYRWVDTMRYLVLLSSSRMPYREISLLNIAATHASKGDVPATRAAYQKVLKVYPDNTTAMNMLAVIEAASGTHTRH